MRKKSRVNDLFFFLISILFTLPVFGHYTAAPGFFENNKKASVSSPAFETDAHDESDKRTSAISRDYDANLSVELVYEATIGSRTLGELFAVRKVLADSVVYLVTSDINAQIGFRLTQDYWLESVYRDGILARSELRNIVNDKVRADTKIRRSGETYVTTKDQEPVLAIPPVKYSVVNLFFSEPSGIDNVFSENYADYIECSPENSERDNGYCIRLPDHTRVFYYYVDGICESFEVKMLIFNVKYSLKSVSPLL